MMHTSLVNFFKGLGNKMHLEPFSLNLGDPSPPYQCVSEGQKDLGRSQWADQDPERQRQLESQTSVDTTKHHNDQ